MTQKGFTPIFLLIVILVVMGLVGGGYYLSQKNISPIKACSKDSKACADGSLVYRTGPNCEFADCPSVKPSATSSADETANWKIYTDKTFGYSIRYPNNWETYAYGYKPEDEPQDGVSERFFKDTGNGAPMDFQITKAAETSYDVAEKYFKQNSETKTINISGIDMLVKIQGNTMTSALFKHGNYVYQLQGDTDGVFDKMIYTIKFQ